MKSQQKSLKKQMQKEFIEYGKVLTSNVRRKIEKQKNILKQSQRIYNAKDENSAIIDESILEMIQRNIDELVEYGRILTDEEKSEKYDLSEDNTENNDKHLLPQNTSLHDIDIKELISSQDFIGRVNSFMEVK